MKDGWVAALGIVAFIAGVLLAVKTGGDIKDREVARGLIERDGKIYRLVEVQP